MSYLREISSGIWEGAIDFEEFDVGLGLPAELTYEGGNGTKPTFEIRNDASEGNYVYKLGQTSNTIWTVSVDDFDGLFGGTSGNVIEVLCRTLVGSSDALMRWPGPAFNINDGDSTVKANIFNAKMQTASDQEMELVAINDNLGTAIIAVDFPDGDAAEWVWLRVRLTWNGGTSFDRKLKAWHGALGDEPAAWTNEQDAFSNSNLRTALGRIGFGQTNFNDLDDAGGVAFLSFSMDPEDNPPPTEVQVAPNTPTITVSVASPVTADLTSSAFSDDNASDTHQASEWEVDENGADFSSPIYDSGTTTTALTTVTATGLAGNTDYLARVRHQDSADNWSSWGTSSVFTTDIWGDCEAPTVPTWGDCGSSTDPTWSACSAPSSLGWG